MRACQNPSPVIDGRRANCNLASLGAQKTRPPTAQHGLCLSHTKSSLSFFICVLSFFYHQNDIFVSISTFMNHVSDPLDHILKTHFHSCCVCLVVN